jgi:hypothetical protein
VEAAWYVPFFFAFFRNQPVLSWHNAPKAELLLVRSLQSSWVWNVTAFTYGFSPGTASSLRQAVFNRRFAAVTLIRIKTINHEKS